IYYPLGVLMLAGIREILVISTPRVLPQFQQLLGDGAAFGISLEYAEQPSPNGLGEAFNIGREFIGSNPVSLILGDNIFYGDGLNDRCRAAVARQDGVTGFAYHVEDPQRYGVVSFDPAFVKALSSDGRPAKPQSN